jgi:hypothetical protein
MPFAPALARDAAHAGAPAIGWMVYLGVAPTAIAFTTWAYALARSPAGRMGSMIFLVPPVAVVLGWAVVGRAIRGTSHLMEHPREIFLAPVMALTVALIALPIKFWAALTMNKQGWLTRQEGQRVQGQAEIGVVQHAGQV